MPEIPIDLAQALQNEAVDDSFERLQPDVRDTFTKWLEHVEDDSLRKRRIARIVTAVKTIKAEIDNVES
ncbi:MAG TPA: YdeI/OmpD-associated family protein [Actinomycetota bacterium]|nr:YdeI/OmpD-associated family protein [Actinomycetota bacterium]